MSINKRAQKRRNINIDVDLAHESRLQHLYAKNLSKGGIYITAERLLPIGSKVKLFFCIKELKRKFVAEAVVIYRHEYETFEDESTVRKEKGMGLKFVNLSPDDEKLIENFISGKELREGA